MHACRLYTSTVYTQATYVHTIAARSPRNLIATRQPAGQPVQPRILDPAGGATTRPRELS